jgi:hypothetical protein
MPEAHTCHLPNSTALFYIGIDRYDAESAADLDGPGGGR